MRNSFIIAIIIVITQILFHKNFKWLKTPAIKTIFIENTDKENYQKIITQRLEGMGINVIDTTAEKQPDNTRSYRITVEIPDTVSEDNILDAVEYSCKIKNTI